MDYRVLIKMMSEGGAPKDHSKVLKQQNQPANFLTAETSVLNTSVTPTADLERKKVFSSMDVREGKNTLNYRSVNNFSPKNTKNIQFNQDLESLKMIDQQTADSVGDYFDRFVKSSKLFEGGRNEINQNNPSKFHFSENKESRQPRQLLGSKDGQFRTNEIPRLQEKIIQKRSNSRSKNSSSKKKNNK